MSDGKWIAGGACEAPLIRKGFRVDAVQTAEISICGLGFFELFLNGQKVSEDLFVPVWSDYGPRKTDNLYYPIHDTFTHRIYYLRYNVAAYLHTGDNILEIYLGNGWYNQYQRVGEGDLRYGTPKLWFSLSVDGKTCAVSDENAVWKPSLIISNNIYYGEKQDFRLSESSDWQPVGIVPAPEAELCPQECPSDRVMRTIVPRLLQKVGNTALYDAGENITGYAVFRQKAEAGSVTKVRYSEELTSDRQLDFESAGGDGQIQSDEFISDGKSNFCRPKFTYHGFRYFEICGNAEDVLVYVIHSDVKPKADFHCDNKVLNRLFDAYLRTQVGNMHTGVVSDSPQRERLGYTGDGQLTADTAMLIFDAEKFYKKWIVDIMDCQDPISGHVQHTAPFYGGGGGPGGWGGAVVIVPYMHYANYRDLEVLRTAYPHMKAWIGYMFAHSEDGLVVREEDGGWCLGDWCTPEPIRIPESYVNSYFLVKGMEYAEQTAKILGIPDRYEKEIASVKQAMRKHFYDEQRNTFCGGIQGADAFALDIGMGNAEMLHNMVRHYEALGCFDTGIFGTDVLISVLFREGFADTAFRLLSSEKNNSFGAQLLHGGATTLWEEWDGKHSHNHHMFGACVKHLLRSILGITADKGIVIAPKVPSGLNSASGRVRTVFGMVESAFERREDTVAFRVKSESGGTFACGGRSFPLTKNAEQCFVFAADEI